MASKPIFFPLRSIVSICLFCVSTTLLPAQNKTSFHLQEVRNSLNRLLPECSNQINVGAIERRNGRDRFRISSRAGRVLVQGSSESAILFGVNWYLNRIFRTSVDYGHTNFLGGAVNADRAAERVILARFQINFI